MSGDSGAAANVCPLCRKPSGCGVAAGQPTCWCFEATVSPDALAALSDEDPGARCLCASCASGIAPSPCIGTCAVNSAGTLCTGCGRRMDEIVRWRSLSNAERWAAWHRLRKERSSR